MNDTDEIRKILIEMRDIQREHLAEYRKASREALELQRRAVERQERAVKFSTRLVFLILLVTGAALGLLFYTRGQNY